VLELYDSNSDQRIWWASASAVMSKEHNPQRLKAAIREMIDRLPTS